MTSKKIFQNVDILEKLNPLNRENWKFETKFLIKTIKPNSKVLQIGCTLGDRLIVLWDNIKPIELWGIDIDPELIKQCKKRLEKLGIKANLFVADAQNFPDFSIKFDYVICLNNTLGYIPNDKKAVKEMKRVTKGKLIVSIYTDTKFTNQVAKDYFNSVGGKIEKIKDNVIYTNEVTMKRYSKENIRDLFGNKVELIETHLGFICIQNLIGDSRGDRRFIITVSNGHFKSPPSLHMYFC
jgi:ubiquinone/menaquinone biosynthesis C-methylase UbiE